MTKRAFLIIYVSDVVGLGNRDRLTTLFKTWHKNGHDVSVLLPESMKDEFNRKEYRYLNVLTISGTRTIRKFTYFRMMLAYIPRVLFGSIAKIPKNIGIIYSMTGIITEVLPAFIFKMRKPNLKWIALIDNLVFSPLDARREQRSLIKLTAYFAFRLSVLMCRKADIILTVNENVKEGLVKLGITADKIVHTSNGIMFDEILTVEDIKEKKFDGVFLGRLDYSKGILPLIKIWRRLCDVTEKNLKLAIVGKGDSSFEAQLKEEIKKCGLQNNVEMLGYLSGKDKYKILKMSRFFAYPSIDESWGIVLMEALACGMPVIAYDLEAYNSIYPEGIIERIPLKDTERFVACLKNIVFNENIDSICKEKIDFARNANWENVIDIEYANIMSRI